jgi:SAM-dependent methyltransferase
MLRQASRKCPVCNHEQVDVLHHQRFAIPENLPLHDGYDVVTCDSCGFVYADTSVSQTEYDRFYSQYSKYEDQKTGTGGFENEWDRERLEETARQIANYLGDTKAFVLDVGCANGGLLKALKNLGYKNGFGIDPSPVCVDNSRKMGINAGLGSLFQPLTFKKKRFDCVILSHTLEHIQDLKQAALWIQNAMQEEGSVYIEVPDAARYTDFVDAPFQDFNTEHINHFSTTSLQNFLRVNKFEPLACGEKVISASTDKKYPAIYCFARFVGLATEIEKDSTLNKHIEEYISASQNILANIETRLKATLARSKRIIVWGTGQLTLKLLVETSLAQADVAAFVDSNPINQGNILRGVRVIAPDTLAQMSEPILIASTLHQQSIIEQIQRMGLNNPLILLKE